MSPFEPVRVAVVGLGYWGPNLVRNLFELPAAEVEVVCDLRTDALEKIAKRYPSVRGTTSLAEVLGDPGIDAIVLATPLGTHYDLARSALEAGKHVLVEKPLADSVSGADRARS